jgi:hypothetical protein
VVLERLPQQVRTPAVARAVTSPSAILLSGAAVSAAVLAGVPLVVAAGAGVLAWAARVAVAAVPRGGPDRINPSAVGEPWRRFVQDALEARSRFAETVRRSRPGPLRDRLMDMGRQLDRGVAECWRIAQQGDALETGVRGLEVDDIRGELAQLEEDEQRVGGDGVGSLARTKQSLRAQLASAERMEKVSEDARNRLRALNAQLDEAVARAVELSVQTAPGAELGPLSASVDALVGELESLRQAMEETRPTGGTGTA